jgi:hypothetical protein
MSFNTKPSRPEESVPRPDEINQLLQALLSPSGLHTLPLITALQGGGGFGKTTLAQHVCYLPEIVSAFSDGILWLQIGQEPNLTELLNYCIHQFDPGQESFTDINLAANHLQRILESKQVLLVSDDVWQERDATLFLPQRSDYTLLVTTRQ